MDTKAKIEQAIFSALDKAVEELYGVEEQGWRDEDLEYLVPVINKHAETIDNRYKR